MTVEIKIMNDDGSEVLTRVGDAFKPLVWRSPYEKPLISGKDKMFAFQYQPTVVRDLRGNS